MFGAMPEPSNGDLGAATMAARMFWLCKFCEIEVRKWKIEG